MASALHFLQSIESSLQRAIAELSGEYDIASLSNRPRVYMVLAKLRERRTTVNNAIIDLLQERISIKAPPAATIAKTQELTDKLQKLIREAKQYDAMLQLLSDISTLITDTFMEPAHV